MRVLNVDRSGESSPGVVDSERAGEAPVDHTLVALTSQGLVPWRRARHLTMRHEGVDGLRAGEICRQTRRARTPQKRCRQTSSLKDLSLDKSSQRFVTRQVKLTLLKDLSPDKSSPRFVIRQVKRALLKDLLPDKSCPHSSKSCHPDKSSNVCHQTSKHALLKHPA